jgi:excisionase family DNA binding protein
MSEPVLTPASVEPRWAGRPVLLSPEELAGLLGVPVATIYRWRSHGEGPHGFRIGRHVRYRLDDVDQWLESRRDPASRRNELLA